MILKDIVELLEEATGLDAYPAFTGQVEPCIVYEDFVVIDDGAKAIHTLNLRIIGEHMADIHEASQNIRQAFCLWGEDSPIEGVTICSQNGGGILWHSDVKRYHMIMYLQYITKGGL